MLTKNQAGALTLYLDGDGIDEHFGYVTSGGAVPFMTDYLGSVINTAPANGTQGFGVFGETNLSKYTVNSSADVAFYGFAGRTYDRESGLYYMRARMYDPNQGRFATRDPMGLDAGDDNLYRYAFNNPLIYTDPTGLVCNYNQSTGSMSCYYGPSGPERPYYTAQGYSGNGEGMNNPQQQGTVDVGPIPAGTHTTGATIPRAGHMGRNAIPLTPDQTTSTAIEQTGRNPDTFYIHGDSTSNPGTASNGCVILPPSRTAIHSGETLYVSP